jgi:hypothetical protein
MNCKIGEMSVELFTGAMNDGFIEKRHLFFIRCLSNEKGIK